MSGIHGFYNRVMALKGQTPKAKFKGKGGGGSVKPAKLEGNPDVDSLDVFKTQVV